MAPHPSAILIVDDDDDHAQIAQIVLRALLPAAHVERCADPINALAATAALPAGTLVLMDRMIDGVESFDVVVEMHGRRPDLAIVMLSAALSSIDRAYAIACGAREAIEKPGTLAGWRSALGAIAGVGGTGGATGPERRAA